MVKYRQKKWQTVCDSGLAWQLLMWFAGSCSVAQPWLGEGVSASWPRELQCVGNESLLASCPRVTLRGLMEPRGHRSISGPCGIKVTILTGPCGTEAIVTLQNQGVTVNLQDITELIQKSAK